MPCAAVRGPVHHGAWPRPRRRRGARPHLAASSHDLAERARAEEWSHEECLAACLQHEGAPRDAHGTEAVSARPASPFGPEAACLFSEFISGRCEHASVIVTSNMPFGRRGGDAFGDDTDAMIDRLVHMRKSSALRGDSFRTAATGSVIGYPCSAGNRGPRCRRPGRPTPGTPTAVRRWGRPPGGCAGSEPGCPGRHGAGYRPRRTGSTGR
ncbi:ATP-binding protein [Streptomyces sp. KLMMK]|uniref:ATP-binding protein n=1 Tax=Streptomyces sp. KLMMK TaxID=3109353 RepID=UPI002FFFE546